MGTNSDPPAISCPADTCVPAQTQAHAHARAQRKHRHIGTHPSDLTRTQSPHTLHASTPPPPHTHKIKHRHGTHPSGRTQTQSPRTLHASWGPQAQGQRGWAGARQPASPCHPRTATRSLRAPQPAGPGATTHRGDENTGARTVSTTARQHSCEDSHWACGCCCCCWQSNRH